MIGVGSIGSKRDSSLVIKFFFQEFHKIHKTNPKTKYFNYLHYLADPKSVLLNCCVLKLKRKFLIFLLF